MISRNILKLCLTAAIAVPAVPVMTVTSQAQVQLHELLFGINRRDDRRRQRETREREVQQVQRRAAAPVKRVTGPRYYSYQPAALTTVTVASLLPDTVEAGPSIRRASC